MEKVELPLHEHPLIPFTRFTSTWCRACNTRMSDRVYTYGGYRCNESGCDDDFVLHKDCAKPLQEINHSSHLNHPLKLISLDSKEFTCSICNNAFNVGYSCSDCDFKLDLACVRRQEPFLLPPNSYGHDHRLQLFREKGCYGHREITCEACDNHVDQFDLHYRCLQCDFFIHLCCADIFPEAYHSSHPQHPLKSLRYEAPAYAHKSCLLCEKVFYGRFLHLHQLHQVHHCDVCNFSICRACMKNPPPIEVECPTTHEHQLHLVPRRINFTCNACGTQGDRSPYFCLQCNFMIHRECIGLPRVININRHDHRISYTRRLGHGEWKCRVCRKEVDWFYGGYTCVKCPTFAVHSRCATNKDVWDMVEREGTPEEEEIAPFEVIDDNTIKHFSHEHNLRINNKDDGKILHESVLCKACVFQICSESFYTCVQCDFILHQKCANLPRKKRHMHNNQPFTLQTDLHSSKRCTLCFRAFTGFSYESEDILTLDVRCATTSDSLEHGSHSHPLYYDVTNSGKDCSQCGENKVILFRCVECDYVLDGTCALLPEKVMRKRYDDHPLFLSFGDKNVDGEYWCEACETKVDPKKWFYTCNDCGITLHVSCIVGDVSFLMPGSLTKWSGSFPFIKQRLDAEVVSNTSICRHICFVCNSRCKRSSVLKLPKGGDDVYVCSYKCRLEIKEEVLLEHKFYVVS